MVKAIESIETFDGEVILGYYSDQLSSFATGTLYDSFEEGKIFIKYKSYYISRRNWEINEEEDFSCVHVMEHKINKKNIKKISYTYLDENGKMY